MPATYLERIRTGEAQPLVPDADRPCLASRRAVLDERDGLPIDHPRRAVLEEEAHAWEDRARKEGELPLRRPVRWLREA
jgi:hypothetical protein